MMVKSFAFLLMSTAATLGFSAGGPQIGEPAPAFELQDSEGQTYTLSQFKGKNVVLEFIRSGSWWPFCKAQLGELQEAYSEIESRNGALLVISKYDAKETATWLESNDWTFPVLVDGRGVIEEYGILNQSALSRPQAAGIPHPATFIIDAEGVVRFKNVWEDYKKRTSPETILEELDKLDD